MALFVGAMAASSETAHWVFAMGVISLGTADVVIGIGMAIYVYDKMGEDS